MSFFLRLAGLTLLLMAVAIEFAGAVGEFSVEMERKEWVAEWRRKLDSV